MPLRIARATLFLHAKPRCAAENGLACSVIGLLFVAHLLAVPSCVIALLSTMVEHAHVWCSVNWDGAWRPLLFLCTTALCALLVLLLFAMSVRVLLISMFFYTGFGHAHFALIRNGIVHVDK